MLAAATSINLSTCYFIFNRHLPCSRSSNRVQVSSFVRIPPLGPEILKNNNRNNNKYTKKTFQSYQARLASVRSPICVELVWFIATDWRTCVGFVFYNT